MQAEFEDPGLFQPRYQRNNKRGGLKNLRCFPTCAQFHRERGFCGRMVVLRVRIPEPRPKLMVYGEFVPVSDKNAGLKLDDVVTISRAREICRDKANPTKPWMDGEVIEEGIGYIRFAFNRDKKGWHYGWASNKHTCNASHALQAYIMEEAGPDKLVVKGIFQSPQFTLFCRRRRRFALNPVAPPAPPTSKKRKSAGQVEVEKLEESFDEDDEAEDDDDDVIAESLKIVPLGKTTSAEEVNSQGNSAAVAASPVEPVISKKRASSRAPSSKRRKIIIDEYTVEAARVERMLLEISKRSGTRNKVRSRGSRRESSKAPESSSNTMGSKADDQVSSIDSASTASPIEDITNEELFATRLFECIDEFENDSVLDLRVLENFSSLDEERHALIESLAAYLVEEREISEEIGQLSRSVASSKPRTSAQDKAAFNKFVMILNKHLDIFLNRRGMALQQVDELFPADSQLTGIARAAFVAMVGDSNIESPSGATTAEFNAVDHGGVERLRGTWTVAGRNATNAAPPVEPDVPESPEPTAESQSTGDIDQLREELGYPVMLRKMLSFMEEKFHVELSGNVLSVRLQRRLFSSGAMTIILDGEEHNWSMKMPMFEGIANVWKYRAWVYKGVVHHIHETTENSTRMTRRMWVDDSDKLIIDVKMEEYNQELKDWEIIAQTLQKFVRC